MFQKIVMVIMFCMILTLWYRQERTADYLRTQARVSAVSVKAQAEVLRLHMDAINKNTVALRTLLCILKGEGGCE